MINREILYDRNVTGSYMKIPMGLNPGLDEKLILKRKLSGTLSVEKTYVDGNGQYWYNISGKQSLDTYCRVKEIGIAFVEKLIISICSQLEILEWNLIHTSCLMLDPELIFITNSNQEFIFTLYPGNAMGIEAEFQQLIEYLMKKMDHKDISGVRRLYAIYEKTLVDGYSILDIRQEIIDAKNKEVSAREVYSAGMDRAFEENLTTKPQKIPMQTDRGEDFAKEEKKKETGKKKLSDYVASFMMDTFGIKLPEVRLSTKKKAKGRKRKEKEVCEENVVYPDEPIYMPKEEIHPTICLSSFHGAPRGILMYQGAEQMEDIHITAKVCRIGHCSEAEIQIDRDTISQMHARIDRDGDSFYIEDLNSTNGTYVNEEPLVYKERRQLKANDIVRFADIRYRFC